MWELLVRKEIYSKLTSIFFRNPIIKWITQLLDQKCDFGED
jgi:hypothetical protein